MITIGSLENLMDQSFETSRQFCLYPVSSSFTLTLVIFAAAACFPGKELLEENLEEQMQLTLLLGLPDIDVGRIEASHVNRQLVLLHVLLDLLPRFEMVAFRAPVVSCIAASNWEVANTIFDLLLVFTCDVPSLLAHPAIG